jgi:hypothetical protein
MGYYINKYNSKELPPKGKAQFLINEGAQVVKGPIEFQDNLVCVVENPFFDAAGYAYDVNEMRTFNDPEDHRRKTWLIVPGAAQASGY